MRVWTEVPQTHADFLTGGDVGSRADVESRWRWKLDLPFTTPRAGRGTVLSTESNGSGGLRRFECKSM